MPGESDLLELEAVEERIKVGERAGSRDAAEVARSARATPSLVDVDHLAAARECVEGGAHVSVSESRPARDDHEGRSPDAQVGELRTRHRNRPSSLRSLRH